MSLRLQRQHLVEHLERQLDGFIYAQLPIRCTDRVVSDIHGEVAERRVDELELFVTGEDRWIHCFALIPDFDGGWDRQWRGIVEGPATVSGLIARHVHRWQAAVEYELSQ